MESVLSALVPVFLTIALGIGLKRTLLPEEAHWIGLERLTYYVLFPALIVVNIARADLTGVAVMEVGSALIGSIVLLAAVFTVLRRHLCRMFGMLGPAYTSFFQGSLRWNTYIALAVSGSLAGPAGLAVAAVAIAVLIPLLNIMSVAVLTRHAGNGDVSARGLLVQLARNPFIWSCLVGAAINLLHLPVPSILITFCDVLGRASLALGLLVVGAGLRLGDLHRPRPESLAAAALKLLVLPTIAVTIGLALGLHGVDLLIVSVASSVPSAPNGYVLARQMGGDAPLLAEMLTLQTLFAAFTMPVVIAVVTHL
ncbi:AEC family transporter [Ancylobacter sp. A5.8]|uniref:AEC family transporter n=1 Tax=Ancylobacter gelatini TaxID=2919920 RepID=UPI001F4D47AC|nr:AEC family transporter [Ancylobacter gelatini]MCJ8141513.1 AEC family transporter [Ancylobacter gelatini]